LNYDGVNYIHIKENILNEGHYGREKLDDETEEHLLIFLKEELYELHKKGLVLYYKNNEKLNDIVWLNPTKTVKYIHDTILSKDIIKNDKGIIHEDKFNNLCKDKKIKELLISEKVIFLDMHNCKYIIPGYLQLSTEDEAYETFTICFDKPNFTLKFRNFIPFGLINQLICHYGKNPDGKRFWRDRLYFTLDKNYQILIILNFPMLSIDVFIIKANGVSTLKLSDVEKTIFNDIINLYWGNDKKGYPDDMYISIDGKNFVSPADLDKCTETTIPAYGLIDTGENTRNGEKIKELETIPSHTQNVSMYKKFSNNENIKDMKKIFVSYSKEDATYKTEFKKHTITLQNEGLIDVPFDDGQIEFGVEWDEAIKKKISECDIMVCLISVDFLNTEYIQRVEIKRALDEGKMLVPIVIKPCDWENSEIAKYQVASKGQCISLYHENEFPKENTDVEKAAFWTKIIKEMRDKIFKDKDRVSP
jgi:internalin A